MAFAVPTDVTDAHEGLSPPLPSDDRIQAILNLVSARLRILLPDLEARIAAADALVQPPDTESDLAILARDVVVQAALRRMPGKDQQQVQSQTQQAGPWAITNRFTTDTSGFFPDEDLDLLRGEQAVSTLGAIGTIHTGRPDWYIR